MMRIGQMTPDTVLNSYMRGADGPRPLSLADYRGSWMVLFFCPCDFTFVCPTEIQTFARLHPEFAAERAAVVGASTDSYHVHRAWYESDPRLAGVRYPIVADTAHRLAEAFGVPSAGREPASDCA